MPRSAARAFSSSPGPSTGWDGTWRTKWRTRLASFWNGRDAAGRPVAGPLDGAGACLLRSDRAGTPVAARFAERDRFRAVEQLRLRPGLLSDQRAGDARRIVIVVGRSEERRVGKGWST